MTHTVQNVLGWRPPVFKSFNEHRNLASAIFGHAFGVGVAFVSYDVVKTWFESQEDNSTSIHVKRFLAFLAAFAGGVLAFFIMWFLFGLGYKPPLSNK